MLRPPDLGGGGPAPRIGPPPPDRREAGRAGPRVRVGSGRRRDPQDLIGTYAPPPLFAHLDSEDGRLWINRDGIADFCGDLPEAERRLVRATQGSAPAAVLGASTDTSAWRIKPGWFVVSRQDRAVDPELQRFSALGMGATVAEVDPSHVPMPSRPEAVLDTVRAAARAVGSPARVRGAPLRPGRPHG